MPLYFNTFDNFLINKYLETVLLRQTRTLGLNYSMTNTEENNLENPKKMSLIYPQKKGDFIYLRFIHETFACV